MFYDIFIYFYIYNIILYFFQIVYYLSIYCQQFHHVAQLLRIWLARYAATAIWGAVGQSHSLFQTPVQNRAEQMLFGDSVHYSRLDSDSDSDAWA